MTHSVQATNQYQNFIAKWSEPSFPSDLDQSSQNELIVAFESISAWNLEEVKIKKRKTLRKIH